MMYCRIQYLWNPPHRHHHAVLMLHGTSLGWGETWNEISEVVVQIVHTE